MVKRPFVVVVIAWFDMIDAIVVVLVSIDRREIERSDSRPVHSIHGHPPSLVAVGMAVLDDVRDDVSVVVVKAAVRVGSMGGVDESMMDVADGADLAVVEGCQGCYL